MFSLLHNRAYLRVWIAQIVAELGDGITGIVIIYLAAHLSDNPIVISFVLLSQIIPGMLLGSFVGPLVDRLPKVKIMVSADTYRLFIVLLMIPAQHSLSLLLVLIFLQNLGTIFFEPARTAAVPRIVGEDCIQQSVSLSQATMPAMRMIGPAAGGLLILFHNFTALFILNACTYLISAALLTSVRVPGENKSAESGKLEPNQPKQRYLKSLADGFKLVIRNNGLFALLLLVLPIQIVIGVINTNFAAALLYAFQVPAEHFGFLETTMGIGSLGGALCAPLFLKRFRPHKLLLSSLAVLGGSCILIMPLALWHELFGLAPVYLWTAEIGFMAAFASVPLVSLFVQLTPDGMRGRTSAIFGSVNSFGNVTGLLLGGWLSSQIGIIPSTAWAGGMMAVVAILFPMLKYYRALKSTQQPAVAKIEPESASSSA